MITSSKSVPNYHQKWKETAVKLRAKGLSYSEILKNIPVSKSTISLWCRHVELTTPQKERLLHKSRENGLVGVKAIQTMFWQKRCEAFKEGVELSYELVAKDSKFVAGLMLYWAEGTKKNSTAVTNSDPRIIRFMTRWLKEFFDIKPEQLIVALHLHPGQNENKIKGYWSRVTKIPLSNFRKSFIKAKGSGFRKNILQNGVVKVVVRTKGSTYLLFKILGAINGFLGLTVSERVKPEDWLSKSRHARSIKLKF